MLIANRNSDKNGSGYPRIYTQNGTLLRADRPRAGGAPRFDRAEFMSLTTKKAPSRAPGACALGFGYYPLSLFYLSLFLLILFLVVLDIERFDNLKQHGVWTKASRLD